MASFARDARINGVETVTGAVKYAADLVRPGMLYARVLRSPFPHARITSVDTTAAHGLPGVHAVQRLHDMVRHEAT